MNRKVVVSLLVIAVAIGLAVSLRTANRADSANGNCYTEAQGPSEPTVCS
jgi:hypothetical protein